jgi:hypothetical protein
MHMSVGVTLTSVDRKLTTPNRKQGSRAHVSSSSGCHAVLGAVPHLNQARGQAALMLGNIQSLNETMSPGSCSKGGALKLLQGP